jgi:glycosyltransferase involved in cell wall biosynthesis
MPKKLKILHIIYSLRNGGAERVAIDLIKNQYQKGHGLFICTISPLNYFKSELEKKNIQFSSIFEKSKFRFLPLLPLMMVRINSLIKSYEPDIIHCHLRNESVLCLFVMNIPIIRTLQNSMPLQSSVFNNGLSSANKILIILEKIFFIKKNVHLIACNYCSQKQLNAFLKKYNKKCLTKINNAVDLKRLINFDYSNNKKSKLVIITIGTLCKPKNQTMSILAFNILMKRYKNAELWIIGEGEDSKKLNKLVKKLKINHKIKFLGRVSSVEKYLKQATLYWSTSISEGFSIANLEAISMGIPILATKVDGNIEMFKNFPNCMVEYDDFNSLASKSIDLIEDKKKINAISKDLKKYAVKKYNINNISNKYLDIYSSVTEQYN